MNSPIASCALLALALSSFACASDPGPGRTPQPTDEEKEDAAAPAIKRDAALDRASPSTPDAAVDLGAAPDVPQPTETGSDTVAPVGSLLDNPTGPMPKDLKDVGIFSAFPDLTKVHERALTFSPKHELWSNGLSKLRSAVLPQGEKINTDVRDAWDFPVGTLFFKTFGTTDMTGKMTPVETRVIRRVNKDAAEVHMQWEFHVYEWNPAGNAATLAMINRRIPRQVTVNGTTFTHNIPSTKDCWNCHVANKATIIGFDELRLNHKWPATAPTTLLDQVVAKGWLTKPPVAPFITITGRNPTETTALEYLQGNCAHCHNGAPAQEPGARYPALDLRYTNAVRSTVNVMTMSVSTKKGFRIVPKNAAMSILMQAVEAIGNPNADPEIKPMPTVGVDRADPKAIMVLRDWIDIVTPAP